MTEYVNVDVKLGPGWKRLERILSSHRSQMAKDIHLALLCDPNPHPELRREGENCAQATARIAVEHADALIKELNK